MRLVVAWDDLTGVLDSKIIFRSEVASKRLVLEFGTYCIDVALRPRSQRRKPINNLIKHVSINSYEDIRISCLW